MSFHGEATMVKLEDGRVLFALLKGPEYRIKFIARAVIDFEKPCRGGDCYKKFPRMRAKKDLPNEHYPLLVTFKDINDPKSVQEVMPYRLDINFGKGTKIKRITLEITDEPRTKGKVEQVLRWYGSPEFNKMQDSSSSPTGVRRNYSGLFDWKTFLEIRQRRSKK